MAFRESGLTGVAFAERLGRHEKIVRRMLDPDHATKIEMIDAALVSLGRRLVLTDEVAYRAQSGRTHRKVHAPTPFSATTSPRKPKRVKRPKKRKLDSRVA